MTIAFDSWEGFHVQSQAFPKHPKELLMSRINGQPSTQSEPRMMNASLSFVIVFSVTSHPHLQLNSSNLEVVLYGNFARLRKSSSSLRKLPVLACGLSCLVRKNEKTFLFTPNVNVGRTRKVSFPT